MSSKLIQTVKAQYTYYLIYIILFAGCSVLCDIPVIRQPEHTGGCGRLGVEPHAFAHGEHHGHVPDVAHLLLRLLRRFRAD